MRIRLPLEDTEPDPALRGKSPITSPGCQGHDRSLPTVNEPTQAAVVETFRSFACAK
jgi:hypothetical protein